MKVSIVLTTHNKESLIELVCQGIIDNVSELTREIIVVFDGCVDNTEFLAKKTLSNTNLSVKYVYADDVFETKANNLGLREVTSDYAILIQDDMIVKEKDFDKRMLKPFIAFDDVFAVTSQTSHNNRYNEGCGENDHALIHVDWADRRRGYPRDFFAVREIANRGPLMYCYKDLVELGFLDEELSPYSYDDHDISYRAYKKLNKISGLYWIHYESDPSWGTTRQKNQHISERAHIRNSKLVFERHQDVIGKIKNEDRYLP